jgi:tetraacyldisaccharide 4'-kinase
LADLIKDLGYKVVVISRGYKGRSEKPGGIVSDGSTLLMGSKTAGDEPYMMATKLKDVPVIVGKNRWEAGMLAVRQYAPDVLVLDDAFQHLKLKRDLDLVLLDYRCPFGNGQLFPRGIMREPISALWRADALILTRSDAESDLQTLPYYSKVKRYLDGKPMFKAYHIPYIHRVVRGEKSILGGYSERSLTWNSERIKGRNAFVFSGLANNRDFHRILKGLKCNVKSFLEFSDHHFYSDSDLQNITESAKRSRADFLITTEKDFVRFADIEKWPVDLVVVGIEVSLGPDADFFNTFIHSRLNHHNLGTKIWKDRP